MQVFPKLSEIYTEVIVAERIIGNHSVHSFNMCIYRSSIYSPLSAVFTLKNRAPRPAIIEFGSLYKSCVYIETYMSCFREKIMCYRV